VKLTCRINGSEVNADVAPRLLLSDFIRHELRLTGTNVGCEMGICGACTIIIEGEPARACLMFAVQADGAAIRTVESLAEGDHLNRLQQAMHEHHGLQCGYCTPGILMTIQALIEKDELPADEAGVREALSGNICRCTGYQNIVDAVLSLGAFSSEVETGSRQENASNKEARVPLRFHRSGKGSGK
jgi:aerobic carbon-monoxide dehydrogenase small subunit